MYQYRNRSSLFGPFQSTIEEYHDWTGAPMKYADIYILATDTPLQSIDSINTYFEFNQPNSTLTPNEFYYFFALERSNGSKTKMPIFFFQMTHDSDSASKQIVNRGGHSFVIETVPESLQETFKLSFSTALEKHLVVKSLSVVNSILDSVTMAREHSTTSNVIIKLKHFEENVHGTATNANIYCLPFKTEEPYLKNDFRMKKSNFAIQSFSFITASDILSKPTSDFMILLFSQMIREKVKKEDMEHISRRRSSLREGTLGFKCMHCCGVNRGLYFPSTLKVLQGTPTLLYKHFMTCAQCPQILKDALVRSKKYHKAQISLINSQTAFFSNLFNRVRDASFDGGTFSDRECIQKHILRLCETYSATDVEMIESVPSMISFSTDSPRQVFGTPCTPNQHEWFAITPFVGGNSPCSIQWDPECIQQLQQLIEGDEDYEEMIDLLLND